MHGPVVVEEGGRGVEHVDGLGVDPVLRHELAPHGDVQRGGVHLAADHRCDGGIVRAAVGDAPEILLRVDLLLQQEVPRHQMAGGAALRAETDLLALQIGQRLDARVGLGDEDRLELGVLLALGDGHDLAARAQLRLHVREAAEPHEFDLLVDQGLHRRGVVAHGGELHLHTQFLLQVGRQRRELTHLLGGRLLGDGGDAKDLLGVGQGAHDHQGTSHQGLEGAERGQADHHELQGAGGGLKKGGRWNVGAQTRPAAGPVRGTQGPNRTAL